MYSSESKTALIAYEGYHHQHCSNECSLSASQAGGDKDDEAVPASRLSDKVAWLASWVTIISVAAR